MMNNYTPFHDTITFFFSLSLEIMFFIFFFEKELTVIETLSLSDCPECDAKHTNLLIVCYVRNSLASMMAIFLK